MRLLSYLTAIEAGLRSAGTLDKSSACSRRVDYNGGVARLHVAKTGTVAIKLFRMSSGRTCMRVYLEANDATDLVQTHYPDVDDFSWEAAVDETVEALGPILLTARLAGSAAKSEEEPSVVNA